MVFVLVFTIGAALASYYSAFRSAPTLSPAAVHRNESKIAQPLRRTEFELQRDKLKLYERELREAKRSSDKLILHYESLLASSKEVSRNAITLVRSQQAEIRELEDALDSISRFAEERTIESLVDAIVPTEDTSPSLVVTRRGRQVEQTATRPSRDTVKKMLSESDLSKAETFILGTPNIFGDCTEPERRPCASIQFQEDRQMNRNKIQWFTGSADTAIEAVLASLTPGESAALLSESKSPCSWYMKKIRAHQSIGATSWRPPREATSSS